MVRKTVVLGCLVWCAGCDAVLGIDPIASEVPEITYADPSCASCVDESCGGAETRCLQEPACRELHACLAACPTDDFLCRTACESEVAGATQLPAYRELDRCRRKACVGECLGGGGFADGLVDSLCRACFDAACDDKAISCASAEPPSPTDPVGLCERQWACAQETAPDPSRTLQCMGGYPRPDGPQSNLQVCRQDACEVECPFGRFWGCVGQFRWEEPEATDVIYPVYFKEATSGPDTYKVIEGKEITTRFCKEGDCLGCAEPVSTQSSTSGSIAAALDLSGGAFEGCMEVEVAGFVPTLHYFGHPLARSEGRVTVGMMWSWEDPQIQSVLATMGLVIDEQHGHVLAHVFDCLGDRAPGIVFELEEPGQADSFYYQGTYLYPEKGSPHTKHDGMGGFINVPAGTHVLTAKDMETGEIVSHREIEVRAGWLTQVWMYPTAAP